MKHVTFYTRLKCFLVLLVLTVIDIGPVPVMGFLCISILLCRPLWFKNLVDHIYGINDEQD